MFYYLALGTNLNPHDNAVAMVRLLSQHFGAFTLYPFIETKPLKMNSQRMFFNSLAIIDSAHPYEEIKAITNQIEIELGRDRDDPYSAVKDRVADIDILYQTSVLASIDFSKVIEHCDAGTQLFLRDIWQLKPQHRVRLSDYGLAEFQVPTTIDYDWRAGDIRILN